VNVKRLCFISKSPDLVRGSVQIGHIRHPNQILPPRILPLSAVKVPECLLYCRHFLSLSGVSNFTHTTSRSM